MATYIKGVTDMMPGPTAIAPNYQLLSTTLSTLQNKYDKGFDQVKTMYNSLINSELSSSDNEQFKQDYLKKADAAMSKFAGVDLSNPNNVMQATSVFKPLVDDKQYVRDLFLTKRQNTEISKMLQTKNNSDEKIRTQYNPKMEEWLLLGKQRLGEMKRDNGSIDKATVNSYSPWEDPVLYAMKLAKEQGLKIEKTTPNGLYLIRTLNGEQSYMPFKNWFTNVIGEKFDNQFKIEAELDNEKEVRGLMAQDKNLTREAATRQIGEKFSTEYVKLYNNQLDDLQSRSGQLTKEIKAIKGKNPNGADQATIDRVKKLDEEKIQIDELVKKLQTEKGDDAKLKQKAVDLYANNPAGTYMTKIRDEYAKAFAYNQAYTNMELEYKPDQVALQKDQQGFEWSKMNAQFAQQVKLEGMRQQGAKDLESMKLQADIIKMKMEGKGKNQASGAQMTQLTDVGSFSVDKTYLDKVQDAYNKGSLPYADMQVLGMAAHMDITKGAISQKAGSNIDVKVVRQAILNKATGKALTASENAQLKNYMNVVAPTIRFDNNTSFSIIQSAINVGIRNNKKFYDADTITAVQSQLSNASNAREQWANMYNRESKHLFDLYYSNDENKKYIVKSGNNYSINYAEVNKLDEEDRAVAFKTLIPDHDKYMNQAAKQMPAIQLNPSDVSKYDWSIHASFINNADKMGVMTTNDDGVQEFVPYSAEEKGKFMNIVKGGKNMSEVFDPRLTTYQRKIVDNKEYIQVTAPVNRIATGKGGSVAKTMNFDVNGLVDENNNVVFLVPINKAANLAGNDDVIVDPFTGQRSLDANPLRDLIKQVAGESMITPELSWVSNNGLLDPKDGTSGFPPSMSYKIKGGAITGNTQTDDITVNIIRNDGSSATANITDLLSIPYSTYLDDPTRYDDQIRNWLDRLINKYDEDNTQAAIDQINRNKLRGDLVPWSNTNLSTD
jgi:uncharacterized protein (UPF0335 family)